MEILNRDNAPEISQIEKIEVQRAVATKIKNEIPVYSINAGTQDLVKIELIFPAGMWQQTAPLIGSAVSAMLQEGTSKRSAKTIAEAVDYYGAFLQTEMRQDVSIISVHSLNKHLPNVLKVVEEVITDSIFPQSEWDTYLRNKKQSFIVNNQKVGFVSRKKFSELLFGNTYPYGHNVIEKDFDNLKRESALDFYKKSYTANGAIIVASGNVTDATMKLIEKYFGGIKSNSGTNKPTVVEPKSQIGSHLIEKQDAVQSAIRIGKLLFKKSHPDYPAMQVVNTIFGGYFGSRLMANIREDKGYTYGIGSRLVSFSQGGYFIISTEVGVEVTSAAIKEIYFELHRLQTEKVSESELQLVKNYMLGTFLRRIDGPFALADTFKGIHFNALDYDYFDRYVEVIKNITPVEIMNLAVKYLQKEEMVELVVGKK